MNLESTYEFRRCRDIIARLSIISHVAAVNLEPSSRSAETSRTGNRPPGGVDRRDDRQEDFWMRSADHFAGRLRGCRTVMDVRLVLADAERSLEAWTKRKVVGEPVPGDPLFKLWVREHQASGAELARLTGVSRQYISRIRAGLA